MTIAALEAVLKLYRDPDRLAQRLPTLRLLTRPQAEIQAAAERIAPAVAQALGEHASVQVLPCKSQIGSGSLPVDRLPSACIAIGAPPGAKRAGSFPDRLATALRALPQPVIGRVVEGQLRLDLRCLDGAAQEAAFIAPALAAGPSRAAKAVSVRRWRAGVRPRSHAGSRRCHRPGARPCGTRAHGRTAG